MNSKSRDIPGWLLAMTAVLLSILGAMAWSDPAAKFFVGAVITLVVIERRRSKTVTAALIRVTDEQGEVRGLIAWDGEGIQLGVRTDPAHNAAVAYPVLWQQRPSVAFTFRPSISMALGKVVETVPAIGLYGDVQSHRMSYSLEFSYENESKKPLLRVSERTSEATIHRSVLFR